MTYVNMTLGVNDVSGLSRATRVPRSMSGGERRLGGRKQVYVTGIHTSYIPDSLCGRRKRKRVSMCMTGKEGEVRSLIIHIYNRGRMSE